MVSQTPSVIHAGALAWTARNPIKILGKPDRPGVDLKSKAEFAAKAVAGNLIVVPPLFDGIRSFKIQIRGNPPFQKE